MEALSAAAGADRVQPALNEGRFRGYALQGKLRQDLAAGAVTLGRLSFGLYQPKALRVELPGGDDDLAVLTKGEWRGRRSAYAVATPFTVAAEQEEAGWAGWAGLRGLSTVWGEYAQSPDSPRRLDIRFRGLRLEPVPGTAADLGRWAWVQDSGGRRGGAGVGRHEAAPVSRGCRAGAGKGRALSWRGGSGGQSPPGAVGPTPLARCRQQVAGAVR